MKPYWPHPPPQVLSLPVLPLPAPVSADSGGSHLQLWGHLNELPGFCCNTPASNQSGPEETVQRDAQPAGRPPVSFHTCSRLSRQCLTGEWRLVLPTRVQRPSPGPTWSTSTRGRSASIPSPTGLATCLWSTLSFVWTLCCSKIKCPSCARSTKTWKRHEMSGKTDSKAGKQPQALV